jgi:two-component system, NarL family, response regulator LiaR
MERKFMSAVIRVMVVDDHDVVRRGLLGYLSLIPDFQVVGEAVNGSQAIQRCTALQPDVILMDLMMPEMDGISATREIKRMYPSVAVVVLTGTPEENILMAALQAGATACIVKNTPIEQLAGVIRDARAGKRTLSPEVTEALIQHSTRPPKINYHLTEREQEILALLVKGLSNPDIADRLVISRSTVKFHLSSIFGKLGVTGRTEAVALAIQHHLVD